MKSKFKKQLYDFMSLSAADNDEGEFLIYGDITDDKWYDSDVTPQSIIDAFNEMGAVKTLNLRINSYGGSCVAGNTIVNIIDDYKRKTGAKVAAYIDGIAASMASGISMAADYVYMAENAIFMVHKPYSVAFGNSDDMMHEAEILEKVENTLVKNYMRHFNGTEDELRQLMADESWLTADEALEYGFCDEIVEPVRIAASAKGININGRNFIDEKVKDKFKGKETESDEVFEYDDSLKELGISEDDFKGFEIDSAKAALIASCVYKNLYEDFKKDADLYDELKAKWNDFCTENFGKEMGIDEVLNLAKAGTEVDAEASNKAKAFDKLVNAAIDDAIKSGIRAKGEAFNETKWRKLLNALDYEDIIDQKNEWEAEAKIVNKAGVRVSLMRDSSRHEDKSAVKIEDYKFS